MAGSEAGVRARLWDAPVRIVHWLVVVLVAFSWWASEDHLNWHRWSGYAILGLVAFRILWGFAGAGAARFSSFVKGPGKVAAYVRTLPERAPSNVPGHNPLGGWSVVALLLVLATQVGTGLFVVDIDGFEGGPLTHLVSFETGRALAEVHELSFRILQVLVAVHVLAVLFYLFYKRTNLIGPMITGRRRFPQDPGLAGAPVWRLLVCIALAAALAYAASKAFWT
ncbi:cytochrome b/b6 domain-containing protein [Phenylobacterium sp. VNQ135]|uniref:cytochrome b/b6 domain-containing protein n=1 Tax=Phenylobacterium sp. VNQ135 TaxID=3400922 RepID=UPI003C11B1BF